MPSSAPNTCGKDQLWVVAYYDLLGIQREMLDWANPDATTAKIDWLRTALAWSLTRCIEANLEKRNQEAPDLAPTRAFEAIVFGFADTVVLASPLNNRSGNPQLMFLSIVLATAIPLMADQLVHQVLLRVGVEVGLAREIQTAREYLARRPEPLQPPQPVSQEHHTAPGSNGSRRRFRDGDIAGPAYAKAYALANCKGAPPGIFVGACAVELLREAAAGNGSFGGRWVTTGKLTLDLLMRLDSNQDYMISGGGDTWAVDFANTGHIDKADTGGKTRSQMAKGYEWTCKELAGQPHEGARRKLQWLKTYFKKRGQLPPTVRSAHEPPAPPDKKEQLR